MAGGEVIALLSDSDDDDLPTSGSKPAAHDADCHAKVESKVEAKVEGGASSAAAADAADDEIEIVTASRSTFTAASKPAAKSNAGDDSDDELEFIGAANEQILPHNRQDCLEYRFKPGDVENNLKFCRLCYCWVCNKEASECDHWFRGEKGTCLPISQEADASAADDNDEEVTKSGDEGGKKPASKDGPDSDSKPSAVDDGNKEEKPDASEPHENHVSVLDFACLSCARLGSPLVH